MEWPSHGHVGVFQESITILLYDCTQQRDINSCFEANLRLVIRWYFSHVVAGVAPFKGLEVVGMRCPWVLCLQTRWDGPTGHLWDLLWWTGGIIHAGTKTVVHCTFQMTRKFCGLTSSVNTSYLTIDHSGVDSERSKDAVTFRPRYSSLNQYSLSIIKER